MAENKADAVYNQLLSLMAEQRGIELEPGQTVQLTQTQVQTPAQPRSQEQPQQAQPQEQAQEQERPKRTTRYARRQAHKQERQQEREQGQQKQAPQTQEQAAETQQSNEPVSREELIQTATTDQMEQHRQFAQELRASTNEAASIQTTDILERLRQHQNQPTQADDALSPAGKVTVHIQEQSGTAHERTFNSIEEMSNTDLSNWQNYLEASGIDESALSNRCYVEHERFGVIIGSDPAMDSSMNGMPTITDHVRLGDLAVNDYALEPYRNPITQDGILPGVVSTDRGYIDRTPPSTPEAQPERQDSLEHEGITIDEKTVQRAESHQAPETIEPAAGETITNATPHEVSPTEGLPLSNGGLDNIIAQAEEQGITIQQENDHVEVSGTISETQLHQLETNLEQIQESFPEQNWRMEAEPVPGTGMCTIEPEEYAPTEIKEFRQEESVEKIQTYLLGRGHDDVGGPYQNADGMFGNRTNEALAEELKNIQKAHGIEETGEYDDPTRNALIADRDNASTDGYRDSLNSLIEGLDEMKNNDVDGASALDRVYNPEKAGATNCTEQQYEVTVEADMNIPANRDTPGL